MNYNIFDVLELKNGNLATILQKDKNIYKVEEVDSNGRQQNISYITENDILSLKYKK